MSVEGDLIGAGVCCGQPAEEALIRSGCVLTRRPVPGHIIRVGDHQLSSVEAGSKNERNILHPADDSSGLRRHLILELETLNESINSLLKHFIKKKNLYL